LFSGDARCALRAVAIAFQHSAYQRFAADCLQAMPRLPPAFLMWAVSATATGAAALTPILPRAGAMLLLGRLRPPPHTTPYRAILYYPVRASAPLCHATTPHALPYLTRSMRGCLLGVQRRWARRGLRGVRMTACAHSPWRCACALHARFDGFARCGVVGGTTTPRLCGVRYPTTNAQHGPSLSHWTPATYGSRGAGRAGVRAASLPSPPA